MVEIFARSGLLVGGGDNGSKLEIKKVIPLDRCSWSYKLRIRPKNHVPLGLSIGAEHISILPFYLILLKKAKSRCALRRSKDPSEHDFFDEFLSFMTRSNDLRV